MSAYAGDLTPTQAWEMLNAENTALLIDVRTPAEWNYVGVPDLSPAGKKVVFVPWMNFPSMEVNVGFGDQLSTVARDPDAPLLFICRSGARSRSAAIAMTARGFSRCYNVASGFEGDPDAERHRGSVNGWKAERLPWVQG